MQLALDTIRRPPALLIHPKVSTLGVPELPHDAPYALLLRLGDTGPVKPRVAPSLAAFARMIHRLRRGHGLSLQDVPLNLRGKPGPSAGVSIWICDPGTGERMRYLGWAYLGGAGRRQLQAALADQDVTHDH